MAKLTLSVDEDVVRKAGKIARENGTSVSAMFSRFVESMAAGRGSPAKSGPLTRKLSGIVELPPDKSHEDLLTEALADKYGLAE